MGIFWDENIRKSDYFLWNIIRKKGKSSIKIINRQIIRKEY
jgi:hypothetical protein